MSILEEHKEFIAEQILLHILHEGLIPTAAQIVQLLRRNTENLDLSKPRTVQPAVKFEYGETSSASKINKLSRTVYEDLRVLYSTLEESEKQNEFLKATVLERLELLSKKASDLISRADRLLVTAEDSTGLLYAVGDEFVDASKIDLDETTAAIDLAGQTVHAQYAQSSALRLRDEYDFSRIGNADIDVTILSAGATAAPGTRDSEKVNIFPGDQKSWIYTVATDRSGPVSVRVQIDFKNAIRSEPFLRTRKIRLSPFIVNNSVTVFLQYSQDGITWKDVPAESPERQIAAPTTFLTNEFEFRYLRITLTKSHYTRLTETGRFIHDFGIRELDISQVINFYEQESVLQSQVFPVEDVTKAALSVACEYVPPETSIDYFIRFLVNGDFSEWQKVHPLNRDDLVGASTAEIGNIVNTETEATIDSADRTFNGSQDSKIFILENSVSGVSRVWRNVGMRDGLFSVRQADGRITEAGWDYSNGRYSTFIHVTDPGGLRLDVGSSPMTIDGVPFTGRVHIRQGVHHIEVLETNWYSLEGLYSVSSFDPVTKAFRGKQRKYGDRGFTIQREEDAEIVNNYVVVDPLFPYNHKLLIEGVGYENSFRESRYKVYRGADKFASHLPNNAALSALSSSSTSDRSLFSLVTTRVGGIPEERIAVRWEPFNGEDPRELFVIESLTGDKAEGLVLKAVLKTTNPKKSPSLDGYEIRVI